MPSLPPFIAFSAAEHALDTLTRLGGCDFEAIGLVRAALFLVGVYTLYGPQAKLTNVFK